MKKIVAILLCLIMTLSFVSCNSNDYKLAIELYDSGDYRQALILFENLKDYQDSEERLVLCRYYLAKMAIDNLDYLKAIELLEGLDYKDSLELLDMSYKEYNEDNSFMNEFTEIMKDRLSSNQLTDDAEKLKLDTVIETLSVHENLPFYQEELGLIYANILEGLRLQRRALDEIGLTVHNQDYYNGKYLVAQALSDLKEKFNFLQDDENLSKKLEAKYLNQISYYKSNYDGVCAIIEDINSQLTQITASTGTAWTYNGSTISLDLTNHTKYKHSIEVTLQLYDNKGVNYDSLTLSKLNIKPDLNYTLSISNKNLKRMDYITWEYQIENVYEYTK